MSVQSSWRWRGGVCEIRGDIWIQWNIWSGGTWKRIYVVGLRMAKKTPKKQRSLFPLINTQMSQFANLMISCQSGWKRRYVKQAKTKIKTKNSMVWLAFQSTLTQENSWPSQRCATRQQTTRTGTKDKSLHK